MVDRSAAGPTPVVEFAPAKVNLTLAVRGRREDGYHALESLVAFAAVGDRLVLQAGPTPALSIEGRFAGAAGPVEDNLVLRAARALAARVEGLKLGTFALTKCLPVAAGLGGGSADAAAALRLLARLNGLDRNDPRLRAAAAACGADVPVCLSPCSRWMGGTGDVLSQPIALPVLPAVLVNPAVALPTRDVFAALEAGPAGADGAVSPAFPTVPSDNRELVAFLAKSGNDLEPAAVALAPVIADVLARLRAFEGVRLARMSGSGATCFGLFESEDAAERAACALRAERPRWWIRATTLGGAVPLREAEDLSAPGASARARCKTRRLPSSPP